MLGFEMAAPSLEVPLIVVANMVSVVGVVLMNKMVYRDGFSFPTTLMVFHFVCTWLFVTFAQKMNWFTEKRIPWKNYALLGAAQVGSVAFVNLSLLYNSVSMYQLFKFTNVFMTVLLEFLWINKTYTPITYVTLVVIVGGVTFASVSQLTFSVPGLLTGLMGSLATAIYQIYNKRVQSENGVSPLQLLQYEQPFTALFAAIFACFSDNLGALPDVDLTSTLVLEIIGSCIFAFGVNLTCYLIIGKTSPLTYSVVGHLKTIGILVGGFVLFKEVATTKQAAGLILAFVGIVAYGQVASVSPSPKAIAGDDKPLVVVTNADSDSSRVRSPASPNAPTIPGRRQESGAL